MSARDDLSWVSTDMLATMKKISILIVENQKAINKFFVNLELKKELNQLEIYSIKRLQSSEILDILMRSEKKKVSIGLMSDAGCPGIGDPGTEVVKIAHELGIETRTFVGPNSMILALMNSGLNGQNYAFNGYLPVEKDLLKKKLRMLEGRISKEAQSQLFIETPYRNQNMFQAILEHVNPNFQLSISTDLMGDAEWSFTTSVGAWKKLKPELNKLPTIFILGKF